MHPRADEADAVLLGPIVVALEILAVGANVHVKNRRIQRRMGMLLGDDRLFNGIHAANR